MASGRAGKRRVLIFLPDSIIRKINIIRKCICDITKFTYSHERTLYVTASFDVRKIARCIKKAMRWLLWK